MATQPGSGGDFYSPSSEDREPPFLFVAIRKKWWIFLICLVVSGGVAAGFAMQSSKLTVEANGALLHDGLPVPAGPTVYRPPSIATCATFLTEHKNLNRLIEMHGLELGPVALVRNFAVKPGRSTARIDVTLSWNDEEEAVKLLDDLMNVFIEDVVQRRSDSLDEHIRHTEKMLFASSRDLDKLADRRRSNEQSEGDQATRQKLIDQEVEKLSAAIESIKTNLDSAELTSIRVQTEMKTLTDQLTELKTTYKRKLFADVREIYQDAFKDLGPKSTRRSELQQVGQQLKEIAATINEDQDLMEWKISILEILSVIAPNSGEYRGDLLAPYEREIEKIESRLKDLDRSVRVNEPVIDRLKTRLGEREAKLQKKSGQVVTSSDYARQLEAEWEVANLDRQRIQQQLSGLEQLKECQVREFSITTPAYISMAKSNTKKLFVMATFFTMLALCTPIFVWEYFTGRTITVEQTGRKFGLPVLAQGSLAPIFSGEADVESTNVDSLRLLALRIQQSISQPGSTVLFSSLDDSETTFPLICGLARCFSEREERVLVLDAGKTVFANNQQLKSLFGDLPQVLFADRAEALEDSLMAAEKSTNGSKNDGQEANGHTLAVSSGPIGMSDYLTHETVDLAEIVLPTRYAGVDCICSGRRQFPVEGLATKRMSDVFDRARKQYSMVLVAGPPTSQLADVQLLAARADGILFTAIPGKPLQNKSHEVLQEMLDLEAPIIGIVG